MMFASFSKPTVPASFLKTDNQQEVSKTYLPCSILGWGGGGGGRGGIKGGGGREEELDTPC